MLCFYVNGPRVSVNGKGKNIGSYDGVAKMVLAVWIMNVRTTETVFLQF